MLFCDWNALCGVCSYRDKLLQVQQHQSTGEAKASAAALRELIVNGVVQLEDVIRNNSNPRMRVFWPLLRLQSWCQAHCYSILPSTASRRLRFRISTFLIHLMLCQLSRLVDTGESHIRHLYLIDWSTHLPMIDEFMQLPLMFLNEEAFEASFKDMKYHSGQVR
jgi:hypothetical protein